MSKALEELTPKQLEVFKLVELENLNFHEIGRLTNRSSTAIKQHYDYALKKLRAFYANYPTLLEFYPILEGGGAKWSNILDSSIEVSNQDRRQVKK